jgi:undecaprenyl-diphosphatase
MALLQRLRLGRISRLRSLSIRGRINRMARPPRTVHHRFLAWLGSHELGILLAIGGVAAGIWIFAIIANEVVEGAPLAFDRKLLLAMRRPGDLAPIGPPAVQDAARDITALGGVVVLCLVTAATAGFLALEGKRRMALFVCGSVASGLIVSTVLKDLFVRPRPDLVPRAAYASGASFPSGHSMLSAVTYLTLGALLARSRVRKRLKAYCFLLAALLTFMIGVTRVYLGVHWPTDVLGGWTAGAVWALLCWLAAKWLQSRRTLEREAEHAPSPTGEAA